jgi:putative lipoprotein
MFATAAHHAVLVDGEPPGRVEVLVQRVGAEPEPASSIPAGPWRLDAIRRPGAGEEAVPAEPRYTVEFGADGRYSGQAHCNRYTGAYEAPEAGRLAIFAGAATLAACPPPSIANEYLRALAAVTRHEVTGDELRLSFGSGGLLTYVRESDTSVAALEVGRTFVYDCGGGLSFTIRTGPGEVALWAPPALGGAYLVLSASPDAPGSRYEEGDTAFSSTGDVATFEHAGQRHVDCRSNPSKVPWADAARRGVVFRALGNEPSWYLEIHPDRLALVTDLGATRTETTYAAPEIDGATTTYRAAADGAALTAVVERRPCTDSMSGEAFEAAAAVSFAEQTFRGCGRFLQ